MTEKIIQNPQASLHSQFQKTTELFMLVSRLYKVYRNNLRFDLRVLFERWCQRSCFFVECCGTAWAGNGWSLVEGRSCWSMRRMSHQVRNSQLISKVHEQGSFPVTRFSIYERRHHCRNCGLVFCNKCSRFESEISRLRLLKPVRVCQSCYTQLKHSSSSFDNNWTCSHNLKLHFQLIRWKSPNFHFLRETWQHLETSIRFKIVFKTENYMKQVLLSSGKWATCSWKNILQQVVSFHHWDIFRKNHFHPA